jgi:hypothetical protein
VTIGPHELKGIIAHHLDRIAGLQLGLGKNLVRFQNPQGVLILSLFVTGGAWANLAELVEAKNRTVTVGPNDPHLSLFEIDLDIGRCFLFDRQAAHPAKVPFPY